MAQIEGNDNDQFGKIKVSDQDQPDLNRFVSPTQLSFEKLLTIPPKVQDESFVWDSEFDLCHRVSSISIALDVMTRIYTAGLAHFSRMADIRQRFIESPSEHLIVPTYYCNRSLDTALNTISQQSKHIHLLIDRTKVELSNCIQLRRSTERAFREIQRDMTCSQPNLIRWKNRVSVLRELEHRLKGITKEGETSFYTTPKKSWTEVIEKNQTEEEEKAQVEPNVESTPNVNDEEANESNNMKDNSKTNEEECNEDKDNNSAKQSVEKSLNFTPNDNDNENENIGPAISKEASDGSVVPETPDADVRLIMPTQVSSPRKRNRVQLADQSPNGAGEGVGIPVARNLLLSSRLALGRMVGSPAAVQPPPLMSLQAYGDLPPLQSQQQEKSQQVQNYKDTLSLPPMPPSRSHSADGTEENQQKRQRPNHESEHVNQETSSDDIVPVVPRSSEPKNNDQEQGQEQQRNQSKIVEKTSSEEDEETGKQEEKND